MSNKLQDLQLIKICIVIITISVVAFVGNKFYNQYKIKSAIQEAFTIKPEYDDKEWCEKHLTYHKNTEWGSYKCLEEYKGWENECQKMCKQDYGECYQGCMEAYRDGKLTKTATERDAYRDEYTK